MALRTWMGALLAAISMPAGAHCFSADYSVAAERDRVEAVASVFVTAGTFVEAQGEANDVVLYSADVRDQWQGALPARIVIASENDSGRFPLEIGQAYVVFLQRHGDAWSMDNCGNSAVLDPSSDLIRTLGPPPRPER